MSTKIFFTYFIILSMLVTCSCEKDNPTSNNDKTLRGNVSLFGKNSYFPIVENAIWTYNYNETVKVANIDTVNNTFQLLNDGPTQGSMDGYSGQDSIGIYVTYRTWNNTRFLPVFGYFGFTPLMYENSKISLSLNWSDSGSSNNYTYINHCTITSMSTSYMAPNQKIYDSCIVLRRDISYPNGYDWNPYITQVLYYVKQGVGFVGEVRSFSDGTKDTYYVTSYNIP
jgi:hypothetical protein